MIRDVERRRALEHGLRQQPRHHQRVSSTTRLRHAQSRPAPAPAPNRLPARTTHALRKRGRRTRIVVTLLTSHLLTSPLNAAAP